ncbi:MAG: hypothetical protein H0V51_21550 [Chloroflexi bacterium]|nr:hypothetical protein [Chloroflexota bacterium]
MRIVVTDLTRMQRGYVCVAGVDLDQRRHVRPVLGDTRLPTSVLARHGGPFDLATVVELATNEPTPVRPKVEDHEFSPRQAKSVERMEPAAFWELLTALARPRLGAIFGPDLRKRDGGGATVRSGAGRASLGCLAPSRRPELYLKPRERGSDQVRMRIGDGDAELDLSVTDIRLYGSDHVTPDPEAMQRVSERIAGGTGLLLSVGLTRPFSSSPSSPPVHWLQVNNIHLEDDPTCRLGSESRLRRLVRLIFDF